MIAVSEGAMGLDQADARRGYLRGLLVFAIAATGSFLFLRAHWFSLYDDAYIHMRYASNVLQGCGLRWNCGDARVEGFSSPAYLALSILFRLLSPDAETASQVLGWLLVSSAIAASALAVPRMLPNLSPKLAGAAALVVAGIMAFDHELTLNSVIGMDSPLGMLAGALVLNAAFAPDRRWLRAALGLAVLVRIELVLFVVLLPVLKPARRFAYYLPLLIFLASLELGRWLLFHDLVPNTYWAKSGGLAGHTLFGLRYVAASLARMPLALAAPLALLSRDLDRRATGYFLLVALVWTLLVVRAGGDFYPHGRLLVPLVPALTALGAAGMLRICLDLGNRLGRGARGAGIAGLVLVCGAGAILDWSHRLPSVKGFEEIELWGEIGRWIARYRPHASVATAPIGAIGYFASRNRIIDILGLTSPEVGRGGRSIPPDKMDENALGHEHYNTEWVLAQKPDLIVTTHMRGWQPFRDLRDVKAANWAEWQLMLAILERHQPYQLLNLRLSNGSYWLMFERIQAAPGGASQPPAQP